MRCSTSLGALTMLIACAATLRACVQGELSGQGGFCPGRCRSKRSTPSHASRLDALGRRRSWRCTRKLAGQGREYHLPANRFGLASTERRVKYATGHLRLSYCASKDIVGTERVSVVPWSGAQHLRSDVAHATSVLHAALMCSELLPCRGRHGSGRGIGSGRKGRSTAAAGASSRDTLLTAVRSGQIAAWVGLAANEPIAPLRRAIMQSIVTAASSGCVPPVKEATSGVRETGSAFGASWLRAETGAGQVQQLEACLSSKL